MIIWVEDFWETVWYVAEHHQLEEWSSKHLANIFSALFDKDCFTCKLFQTSELYAFQCQGILKFSDFHVSEKTHGRKKETHSRQPRQAHLSYTYKKLADAGQKSLELVAAIIAKISDD